MPDRHTLAEEVCMCTYNCRSRISTYSMQLSLGVGGGGVGGGGEGGDMLPADIMGKLEWNASIT